MATVKDLVSSLGAADLARRFGGGTANLARNVGGSAADLAKHAGGSAASLARKVGPKRGLIALGVIGAAVGTAFLVRYLRNREDSVEDLDASPDDPNNRRRMRKQTRAKRKAAAAAMTH